MIICGSIINNLNINYPIALTFNDKTKYDVQPMGEFFVSCISFFTVVAFVLLITITSHHVPY